MMIAIDEIVIMMIAIDETVIMMIAIDGIATMMIVIDGSVGMGTTAPTKSPVSKGSRLAYRLAPQTLSAVKATTRNDLIISGTEATVMTRAMGTEASTNRSSVTHSFKATTKVTNVMVATTDAVTMGVGETAACRCPGK